MEKDFNILDILVDKWVQYNLREGCNDKNLILNDILDEITQKKITVNKTRDEIFALIEESLDSYEIKVVKKKCH